LILLWNKKLTYNLRRRQEAQSQPKCRFDFSKFKLKKKKVKKGVKLEQLSKEAEIFILKSKKRKFNQEDLNRFMRELEVRRGLNDTQDK